MDRKTAILACVLSMFIFGTVGILKRFCGVPSGFLAFVRAAVGSVALYAFMKCTARRVSFAAVRADLAKLLPAGFFLGFNWILLFEAYRYTSIPVATLCYYMAPVFIILASPFVLKEKLTAPKLLCVALSFAGMILVSGVAGSGVPDASELRGVLLGLAAAVLYAVIVLLNKTCHAVEPFDRTLFQLAASAVVMGVYLALTGGFRGLAPTATDVLLLAVAGIVHTGVAYALYFGAIGFLSAHSAAILSYIDPVVAIVLASVIFGGDEKLDAAGCVGAILIIGASVASETAGTRERKESLS